MKSEEIVWKRGPKKWRTHLQFEQGYWESHYLFYNLILFENKLKNILFSDHQLAHLTAGPGLHCHDVRQANSVKISS